MPKDHDGIPWSVNQHSWYPGQTEWLGGNVDSISPPVGNGDYTLHITPDGGGSQVLVPAKAAHHDPKPHTFPDSP